MTSEEQVSGPWDDRPVYPPVELTPEDFEDLVAGELRTMGVGLSEFKVVTREVVVGPDGDYEIDITARFEALGLSFLVLIECKHHKNPIKRDVVQALLQKMQSVGAHKGVVFASVGFQKGAILFARKHGIALIMISEGRTAYGTKSRVGPRRVPSWVPDFVPWLVGWTESDGESHSNLSGRGEALIRVLRDGPSES